MKKNRSTISILFHLIGLLKPLMGWMILAIFLGVLGFLAAIFVPLLGAVGILKSFGFYAGLSFTALFIILALCAVFRGALRYGEQACNHYIAFKLLARIRDLVFGKLRKLAPAKLEGKDKGNLISMITSDVELLEVFYAHTISPICIAFLVSLIFVVYAAFQNVYAALLLAVSYLFIGVVLPVFFSKKSGPIGKTYREAAGKLNSFLLENLRGLQIVIQFGKEKEQLEKLDERTDALIQKEDKLKKLTAKATGLTQVSVSIFSVLMVLLCGRLYKAGSINEMQAVMLCMIQFSTFGPVIALSNLGTGLAQTIGAGQRILDLLDEPIYMKEVTNGKNEPVDEIQLKSVNFAYPDGEKVLNNFSMTFKPNKIYGLQGPSGCGKSTTLKLMMRFWDPQSGEILVDNENIKNINTACLRKNESYLTQESVLFDDTIENNLKIAKEDASEEEMIEACKKAAIHDFILSLPNGYKSQVGELGSMLSGGERQRIGLARAFLHGGKLLLLDEPTSNLDSLNEGMILKSVHDFAKGKTVVIVSHRKSSLKFADEIIGMEPIHEHS